MEILIVGVVALIVIAGAAALGPRVRVASPLILVVLGIVVSFLPILPDFQVDPEVILAGILPPLLYSTAVSMPAMNFRRELNAIGGLSVVLVVVSAVVLGLFFAWVIPDLGIWWGIALGAIVSPTDAVATSIVKRLGVGGRIVSVLEGESLLNDATALVLLRSAIAATAAALSFGEVVGQFAYAVAVAVVLGFVVGHLNLRLRERVTDSTVNTVLSFTVPFLASVPAEMLGASGLVAAVVAGLITGHGAARRLPPQHRASDAQNWRTVELVLEGAIFLIMGLELSALVADVQGAHEGVRTAIVVALGALVLTVLVRAAFITPLLGYLGHRRRRRERAMPRIDELNQRLGGTGDPVDWPFGRRAPLSDERLKQTRTRMRRLLADMDYYVSAPLGWREGGVLVWAGMRGAVTLAAAQTLPADTPNRSLLVLVAFVVAAASLILQGGTLARVVRWLRPAGVDAAAQHAERAAILDLLGEVARNVREELGVPAVRGPVSNVGAGDRTVVEYGAIDSADAEEALTPEGQQQDVLSDARDPGGETRRGESGGDGSADDDIPSGSDDLAAGASLPDEAGRGDAVSRADARTGETGGGAGAEQDDDRSDDERSHEVRSDDESSEDDRSEEERQRLEQHARVRTVALAVIVAQRRALLDARDDGTFDAESLDTALATLDAAQISIELQGAPPES
jgi:CPA1 family monovalent cation:H+ antiporter